MATQDFAKRNARRSSNNGGRKKPPKRSGLSWRLISVLVLLGLFIAILVKLATVKTDPQVTQEALAAPKEEAKEEKPKPRTKVKPATDVATKDWDFYKMLPESEVPLPPGVTPLEVKPPAVEEASSTADKASASGDATPAKASDSMFMLQVGAFRTQPEAEKVRAQLLLKGFSNVSIVPGDGWYRVRLGPLGGSPLIHAEQKLYSAGMQSLRLRAN
ncbi:SPOR domain-containing protein [Pokkaliibacter sp. CJK22405]|uniref:SPOR domain-containing protein n=1 Tax=Pokkaliibacter sp. CJK22405 TaxID=3384615 RepID=UPI0039852025